MFRDRFIALMIVSCGGLLVSSCAHRTRVEIAPDVTFTKAVAPILYQHCVACHHSGGIGPMPLLTYAQAKPFSSLIRDRVVKRIMPPWFADAPLGEFSNDPRLSEAEIHTITAWVDRGAPEGDPKESPPQPKFSGAWVNGQPDAVFSMAKEYTVPAHGEGVYANFKIPTHFEEDKWVQAFQVLPENPRFVHHAVIDLRLPVVRAAARKKGRPNRYMYEVGTLKFVRADAPVVNDGCSSPWGGELPGVKTVPGEQSGGDLGDIGVYLPGRSAEYEPEGDAVLIPAGAILSLTMHYMPMGMVAKDRTEIGFWFAKEPVKDQVRRVVMENMLFKIPAGDPDLRATSCFTFPKNVQIISYTVHMHYRGKDATLYAIYPNGKQERLFSIPHYNFNWQLKYILGHPKPIPQGTVIKTVAHFDNSRDNPLNPDPTKTIRWGDPSDREMLDTIIEFIDGNKEGVTLAARRRG
jgi:hypothetical protein